MSTPRRWTIEQVMAVAPSPAGFAAAEAVAAPAHWAALGADRHAAWGRCRGSGREPYDTVVDHAHVAWRCSCPSRSQPCKHAVALLAMWARGQVPDAVAPAPVAAWTQRIRAAAQRAAVAADRSRPAATADPFASDESDTSAPGADASEASASPPDTGPDGPGDPPVDLRRGRDERVARLVAGLVELDRWLDDRVRTGLAHPSLAEYATWDGLAARLVDARAGALASRVRRLAGVVGARADWHDHVLAEIGVLHLLAQAGQRVPDLPGPLADAVATACGWQVRQADVLAGVPETDTWIVAGRSDTREDRIEVRRTWLRGATSGRWAMVLSFAAYRQSLDASLVVGSAITADLHRYPGGSVRALVGAVHDASATAPAPAASTVDGACVAVGTFLAAEPWADRVPATVHAAPTVSAGRWVLTDRTGSLPLAPDAPGVAILVAASAGDPVVTTFEWTVDGAVPLTVHLPDRTLDVGPRADPSFVSAA